MCEEIVQNGLYFHTQGLLRIWNDTFEATKQIFVENALRVIDTVNPSVFTTKSTETISGSDRRGNLNDFERLLGLLLSFEKQPHQKTKSEVRQNLRERITQLRSEKLLNLDFAEICISSSVIQALSSE